MNVAMAQGDPLGEINNKTRMKDEARHVGYAEMLAKALVEDDPDNLPAMQRWQDDLLPLYVLGAGEVFKGAEKYLGTPGLSKKIMDDSCRVYTKRALPLELKPTAIPGL
jgi:hypothetical protein